jgi:GNAT superfamily N-acetyltransferase
MSDLNDCASLLIDTYNCPPWNNNWTYETAVNYLKEKIDAVRFTGFVLCEDENIVGACFCCGKTWWSGDEVYVEEFYISPDFQNKGLGSLLFSELKNYAAGNGFKSITLLTNQTLPALGFYKKQGMKQLESNSFMYLDL